MIIKAHYRVSDFPSIRDVTDLQIQNPEGQKCNFHHVNTDTM
jgi:hypothetical protein